jgi:hypothetical protein
LLAILKRRSTVPPWTRAASPLFAALKKPPQFTENTTTLTLLFAALTQSASSNPFICHSYKKSPGYGVPRGVRQPRRPISSSRRASEKRQRLQTRIHAVDVPGSARGLAVPSSCFSLLATTALPCTFLRFSAFFCTAQTVIPFYSNRFRALCTKHPGVGSPTFRRPGGNGHLLRADLDYSLPITHFFRSRRGILRLS